MTPSRTVKLTPGKRVLFLTKDAELIRRQLRGDLDLTMNNVTVDDLLDDINTDTMTPAWVCFSHKPEDIAREAYAGHIVDGERVFERDALRGGNFEVIVSGHRKGVGSSRETAVHAEKHSGIRLAIAASFAPIHARNNVNQGVLMGDYDLLRRLQDGEEIDLEEFCAGYDPITRLVVRHGGLFPFAKALADGSVDVSSPSTPDRPMNMTEKILARHLLRDHPADSGQPAGAGGQPATAGCSVKPGDALLVEVDGGYSHDFTSAQVHHFLQEEYGEGYRLRHPERFAAFEDHLVYAEQVAELQPLMPQVETMRELQRQFQQHANVSNYLTHDGESPGICHEVAREQMISPGDFIQATDSHTCMGGCNNALSWGVGATEYANLLYSGFTFVEVPETIRFELAGTLPDNVTAKDVMLYILLHFAKQQMTLNRVIEFTGPGVSNLSMDERATLTNMATECSARGAIVEADDATFEWIAHYRPGADLDGMKKRAVRADANAEYGGGVHAIDLSTMVPMVAHPGDPDHGVPSDPTNGALVSEIGRVDIDIAYGGSCTAGKADDLEFYHRVVKEAVDAGLRVPDRVAFLIQYGSAAVEEYAVGRGFIETFERAGITLIKPGCGACIGCGPGVSEDSEQVSVSAINRNYKGRSGPGKLYLASPLTVAASAFTGYITAYEPGMFVRPGKR
ncbi:MAG: aconitate hydratase [Acidobacteria bacterium]|nr:aconitate hydratase [Acidobacteriota bacterium]